MKQVFNLVKGRPTLQLEAAFCNNNTRASFLHEKSCNRPNKSNLQLRSTFIFTTFFTCSCKIPKKKAILTLWVSLVVDLGKTERLMKSRSILSRRFYLKGDMMKLYPFIQGSLEWPCSELFSANVSLWNHCNYLVFNAFSCGILNISYKPYSL